MFAWIFGIVLFAVGICLSVALHEAGHMLTAKWFGMKVRRYFIGYGPTIWSFHRGGTEYGLKALPLGGFCDIAGMTALDEVTPEEKPRAMWRYPAWKRVVVMSAGSITHFILGFVVLYLMAVTMGLPSMASEPVRPVINNIQDCVRPGSASASEPAPACTPGDPAPAKDAGIRQGDEVVSVNGKATPTWEELVKTVQGLSGPSQFVIKRAGQELTVTVNVPTLAREYERTDGSRYTRQVGVIGVTPVLPSTAATQYNALTAFGGAAVFTGDMFARVWEGLLKMPEKVPAVIKAIGGGERDVDTPVSMVGASIIGGDAVERGLWPLFLILLASLNFFVGVFNLLPLLPMDGGHIAVLLYEKVRDWVRKLRGKPAGGPVDYTKLAGLTMVVVFIGGAYVLLTVTADIVNPIRLQ